MTKKITVYISTDGTGNNKNSGTPTGNESNVARLHDKIETDLAFDFSENKKSGTDVLDEIAKVKEGTKESFPEVLKSQDSTLASADSYKFYLDGVGSQENKYSMDAKWEGATGFGTTPRVEQGNDQRNHFLNSYFHELLMIDLIGHGNTNFL